MNPSMHPDSIEAVLAPTLEGFPSSTDFSLSQVPSQSSNTSLAPFNPEEHCHAIQGVIVNWRASGILDPRTSRGGHASAALHDMCCINGDDGTNLGTENAGEVGNGVPIFTANLFFLWRKSRHQLCIPTEHDKCCV